MNKEKELPKEVVDDLKKEHIYETLIARNAAKIAQSHYEPIIDGLKKDKERLNAESDEMVMSLVSKERRIAELEAKLNDKRDTEEQYLDWINEKRAKEDNANEWGQIEPHPHYGLIIEAKDKEIERMATINKAWILKGAELEASNNKLMGLLKASVLGAYRSRFYSHFGEMPTDDMEKEYFNNHLKEHHITPYGERKKSMFHV